MFVSDVNPNVDKIFMTVSENGSFQDAIFCVLPLGGHSHPVALAFDHRSRTLYWVDYEDQAIYRSTLDGSRRETIIRNLGSKLKKKTPFT